MGLAGAPRFEMRGIRGSGERFFNLLAVRPFPGEKFGGGEALPQHYVSAVHQIAPGIGNRDVRD